MSTYTKPQKLRLASIASTGQKLALTSTGSSPVLSAAQFVDYSNPTSPFRGSLKDQILTGTDASYVNMTAFAVQDQSGYKLGGAATYGAGGVGDNVVVSVQGGGNQTVSLATTLAGQYAYLNALNAGLTGVQAINFDGRIKLVTTATGAAATATIVSVGAAAGTTTGLAAGAFTSGVSTGPQGTGATILRTETVLGPAPTPPSVVNITPATGPIAGATAVTIQGSNFTNATSATVGGVKLTAFTVVNDGKITGTTAAMTLAGPVTVEVNRLSHDYGTTISGTLENGYTVTEAPPTLISAVAAFGALAGGTAVTLTGTFLAHALEVAFDNIPVAFVIVGAATITTQSPAHAAAVVNIRVRTPGGTATVPYTYVSGVSTPLTVLPTHTAIIGGTAIAVTGTGFIGTTDVSIDGTPCTAVVVVNDTNLTAVSPALLAGGPYDLTVTNPLGTGTLAASVSVP